jgi:hypothetical protein
MRKSIKVHPKKRRGRPATGKDPLVSARLPQELIDSVEAWASANSASRSEAVRRLIEIGLTVGGKPKHTTAATADRAKELASKAIDSLTAGAANNDEKASRKRRLIKGPEEFREDRVDRPKAKGKS